MELAQAAKITQLHKNLLDAQQKSCNPIDIRLAEPAAKQFAAARVVYNVYVAGMVSDPAQFAELERLEKALSDAHQRFVCPITKADRVGGFTAFQDAQVAFTNFVKTLVTA